MGAVALNNWAVLLLERGRYRQALTVLEDAVSAIRHVMTVGNQRIDRLDHQPNEDHDAESPLPCTEQAQGCWMTKSAFQVRGKVLPMEQMLQRAFQYAMETDLASATTPGTTTIEAQILDVDVPQLTVSAVSTTDEIHPFGSFATLIRIDAIECRDFDDASTSRRRQLCCGTADDDADDLVGCRPHLESITILHNYAVAAGMLPLSEQGVRRNAARASHLAFQNVCRLLLHKLGRSRGDNGGSDSNDANSTPSEDVAMLQLSLLLAKCNYQLCVDLGDRPGAGRSLTQYRIVQRAMDSDEVRFATRLGEMSVPHAKAA